MDWDRRLIKALLACGYDASIGDTAAYCSGTAAPIKALSQKGLIDEHEAIRRIAKHLSLPYFDLCDKSISSRFTTANYESRTSSDFCWSHKIVPLFEDGGSIFVACANPLDLDAILASAQKTGRVLVVHEDKVTGGFGGEISALITEKAFTHLDAPVMRVGSLFTPVGFAKAYEDATLPSAAKIAEAARKLAVW